MEEYEATTKQLEELLLVYKKPLLTEEEKHLPKIQVSTLTSKVAFLYEKIRNTIDYKAEHLLRKNAIKRILRRRLTLGSNAKKAAAPLVYELIQARYLQNNAIPENKINQVSNVIHKYILLVNDIFSKGKIEKNEKRNLMDWLLSLAACEIEDLFSTFFKQEAMVRFMYQIMKKSIVWSEEVPKEDRDIQIYIAVHRCLLKSDREIISFRLFNLYYPGWQKAENEEEVLKISANIHSLYKLCESQIDHKLSFRLLRVIRKYTAPFIILEDVILKNIGEAEEIFSSPKMLEEKIQDSCSEAYREKRKKLTRSSIRAIIYIFLTKMLLALILEVPYDLYVAGVVHRLPLLINIIFHPFLLFLIALMIRVPKEENTSKIIKAITKVVYQGEEEDFEKIKPITTRHIFFSVLFNFVYLLTFGFSFGLIIWGLSHLQFNLASGAFFLLFLSLVSFFGIRNREQARELIVVGERERVRTTIIDFFAIPILRAGRWISLNFSKINIFVFVFDFIIEAPFKAFVEIIDDFFAFIKEKKEEITLR
jgi:hypothetical protein